ncbi:MAG: hypothetical protein AAAB23_24275, partial [Pseudomonas sp.]
LPVRLHSRVKGRISWRGPRLFCENSRSSLHAKSLTAIKSFKNNELRYFCKIPALHFAMMAFCGYAICTVNKATLS